MDFCIKFTNDPEKVFISDCQKIIVISKSDRKSFVPCDMTFYHFDTNNDYIFESNNILHVPGKRIEYIVVMR